MQLTAEKYGRKANPTYSSHPVVIPKIEGAIRVINSQEIQPALISIISRAEKNIYISVYQAVYLPGKPKSLVNQIWHQIKEKVAANLDVKVLINQNFQGRTAKEINQAVAKQLRKNQIPARFHAKNIRGHAKYYVVDGRYSIIGSHNLSERAVRENYEISVYIDDKRVGTVLEETFLENWKKGVLI